MIVNKMHYSEMEKQIKCERQRAISSEETLGMSLQREANRAMTAEQANATRIDALNTAIQTNASAIQTNASAIAENTEAILANDAKMESRFTETKVDNIVATWNRTANNPFECDDITMGLSSGGTKTIPEEEVPNCEIEVIYRQSTEDIATKTYFGNELTWVRWVDDTYLYALYADIPVPDDVAALYPSMPNTAVLIVYDSGAVQQFMGYYASNGVYLGANYIPNNGLSQSATALRIKVHEKTATKVLNNEYLDLPNNEDFKKVQDDVNALKENNTGGGNSSSTERLEEDVETLKSDTETLKSDTETLKNDVSGIMRKHETTELRTIAPNNIACNISGDLVFKVTDVVPDIFSECIVYVERKTNLIVNNSEYIMSDLPRSVLNGGYKFVVPTDINGYPETPIYIVRNADNFCQNYDATIYGNGVYVGKTENPAAEQTSTITAVKMPIPTTTRVIKDGALRGNAEFSALENEVSTTNENLETTNEAIETLTNLSSIFTTTLFPEERFEIPLTEYGVFDVYCKDEAGGEIRVTVAENLSRLPFYRARIILSYGRYNELSGEIRRAPLMTCVMWDKSGEMSLDAFPLETVSAFEIANMAISSYAVVVFNRSPSKQYESD